ncbi:hypothetical protein BBO_02706 [Beauveria brongniartii RCEF 3172]|uniref:Uncharacterized protein n=1 Tax=Beauveria brongniartii RCEF 3172 TaxID=1081107 RepID=A0A167GYE2_9HYPO|nr:hypothetical protein BBO_02706 [Beauveria brongniartii RCEF 3172]
MAPVQTFSSSPIVAAKAPTATTHSPTTSKTMPATATAAPSSSSSYSSPSHGQTPPAQPAARPSIPAATSSASFSPRGATGHAAAMLPTPTQQLISDSNSPPAPQPGAVPIPPGAATAAAAASTSSTLPPPPKSGETLGPEHTGAAAAQPPRALPAQLSYPPPTASHTSLRGTSAAVPSPYEVGGVGGGGGGGGSVQLLPGINRATDLSHPPGYQQDAQAAEFSSGQRAAHEAYVAQHSNRLTSGLVMGMGLGAGGGGGGEAGAGDAEGTTIWNTAKKWASAAGDTLAAAEGEVWKAVNKDHK